VHTTAQVILKAAGSEKDEVPLQPSASSSGVLASSGKRVAGAAPEGGKAKQGSASKAGKRATPAKSSAAAGPSTAASLLASEVERLEVSAAAPRNELDTPELLAPSGAGPSTSESAGGRGAPAQSVARVVFSDTVELLGSSPTATVPAFGPLGPIGARSPGEPGTQVVGGFRGLDQALPPSAERAKGSAGAKSKEKSKRKGKPVPRVLWGGACLCVWRLLLFAARGGRSCDNRGGDTPW
jgi:hypothetical protein